MGMSECGCWQLRLSPPAVFRPQSLRRLPAAQQAPRGQPRKFECMVCGNKWEWTQHAGWAAGWSALGNVAA
jgi:hypothetical protein